MKSTKSFLVAEDVSLAMALTVSCSSIMRLNLLLFVFIILLASCASPQTRGWCGTGVPSTDELEEASIVIGTEEDDDDENDEDQEKIEIREPTAGDFQKMLSMAEAGNANAQALLGRMYSNGIGVESDMTKAIYWLEKAANQDNTKAMLMLGNLGRSGGKPTEALTWYSKCADMGEPFCQYFLGDLYFHGSGVKKDLDESIKWWRKAEENGQAQAMHALGLLHGHGLGGFKKDKTEAAMWLRKAGNNAYAVGNATLLMELGNEFWNGTLVKRDYTEALKWYNMATKVELPTTPTASYKWSLTQQKLYQGYAYTNMASIYRRGLCVEIDKKKAEEYELAGNKLRQEAGETTTLQKEMSWLEILEAMQTILSAASEVADATQKVAKATKKPKKQQQAQQTQPPPKQAVVSNQPQQQPQQQPKQQTQAQPQAKQESNTSKTPVRREEDDPCYYYLTSASIYNKYRNELYTMKNNKDNYDDKGKLKSSSDSNRRNLQSLMKKSREQWDSRKCAKIKKDPLEDWNGRK
ncbi:MAG: sel1 repeat family protein [Fibromonadaceae bacterium]|jgi:TPR repeat protein|nr:sel1 repeat family protein [Fibromonadaceae bacterium]